ncbi:MAG: GNAT family N-acetyltransferase [Panacibacter sp.]
MQTFSNGNISIATITDIPALRDLLNSSYRGESARKGWTHESHLISGGVRTNDAIIQQVMQQAGSVFLKFMNEEQKIIACVNLQQHDERIYLGMFSVSPQLQGGGIGKQLLHAAEEYAKNLKCKSIYMSVISVRTELIDWYKRHGYQDTGERKPFHEDAVSGKHVQPLEFMMLEKALD